MSTTKSTNDKDQLTPVDRPIDPSSVKTNELTHLKSVLLEPVRSADPPMNSGTTSAMAWMIFCEYLRDPIALS